MLHVYGLKNCDTCRKALKWLAAEGARHEFHDVRADGLEAADMARWVASAGWEQLLNRRGTTWRKLDDADKADVDEISAQTLMLAHPALIKRPVFEAGNRIVVGFKAAEQAQVAELIG